MNLIKNIIKQPLFKITSLNSFHIILKLVFGILVSKVLAIFVGANGMALVGNFRVFLNIIENFSLLGIQNAVVKYVSENKENPNKLKQVLSTFGILLLISSVLISIVIVVLANFLSKELFHNSDVYSFLFYILAVAFPLYIFSTFCISVINGFQEYKKVILVQIISSVTALFFSILIIYYFKLFGALISLIVAPIFVFLVAMFYLNKIILISYFFSFQNFEISFIKNASQYVLMALFSGVFGSYVMLEIRKDIIVITSLHDAGIYEGLQRISSYYMLFVSSVIALYFYPKLTEKNANTKALVIHYLKTILPIFTIGLVVIYFLKKIIIQLLFTTEFETMEYLFLWQLIGDFLKAVSLFFGTILIAQKRTKAFIITEIFSLLVMYFTSNWMLHAFQIKGITISHTITYFIYLIVMIGVFFYHQRKLNENNP